MLSSMTTSAFCYLFGISMLAEKMAAVLNNTFCIMVDTINCYSGTPKCGHPEIRTSLIFRTLSFVPMQYKCVLFYP